jgi:hypothetical protein
MSRSNNRHSSMDTGIQSQGRDKPDSNAALLSDEQLEHYATIFMALNECYELTRKHYFTFEDFLESPQYLEFSIKTYFANPDLFNRPEGGQIHLHIWLRYPRQVLSAIKKMTAAKKESALKVDLVTESWFQDLVAKTFERKHRVVMRGDALVELFPPHHHVERKQAGGKR